MHSRHIIDTSFISKQIGDSPEIITEMSVLFLEGLREYQKYIKKGIDALDFEAIHLQTHKIKPSLSMFGLIDILELVAAIEKAAKVDKDIEKIMENSAKLEAELPLIYNQIEEIIVKKGAQ